MRCAWLLVVCTACTAIDQDLLGPAPAPCDLGAVGVWTDVTPAGVAQLDPNPGIRGVALDPLDPSVIYAITHAQGVWRSPDCGATWTHTNTGINGPLIERAESLDVATDPVAPDTVYVTPRFGGNSVWMSENAGVHWTNLVPPAVAMPLYASDVPDLAYLAVFPDEPHHLLATSMAAWQGAGGDAGVLEGQLVDGAWRWTAHAPAVGMGIAQSVTILDARTWLVASSFVPTGEGTWITRDGGASFVRVDDHESFAGGAQVYRSPDGTLYRPVADGLLRSADAGVTWIDVFAGLGLGGTTAIVGDGATLYASAAIPDGDVAPRLFTAPEVPGDRGWAVTGAPAAASFQRFVRDPVRDVLYAWNGYRGVSRVRLR